MILAPAVTLFAGLCAPAVAQVSTGGMVAGEPPTVSAVSCRLACGGLDRAAPGSTVRLAGEALDGAAQVAFLGRPGRGDDKYVPATAITPTSVEAVVPAGARSGRVRVIAVGGQLSKATTRRLVVGRLRAASAAAVEARVDSKRVFLHGRRKPSLSYYVGAGATHVRVDLVRDGAPAPVASWTPGDVASGTVQTVEWDPGAGPPPAPGRYEFRVTADTPNAPGAQAAQAGTVAASGFLLLDSVFPVRGPHDFGGEVAHFGGGRGHEGQDVFAACGTPLVAAHSGRVKHKDFQTRAGNYVVIAGDDGIDHAYMHLRDPALVEKDQVVATGQPIGFVGETGRAQGCHLHFEKWTAPGWYTGGSAVDPLPDLQAWDTTS